MERLSFVLSFLLIVSLTVTLGSVIKAKNPNGEELEALLKRSHDAHARLKGEKSSRDKDSEMSKHIGVQRGIPERKVAITIENENDLSWSNPERYPIFGTIQENGLPEHLAPGGKAVLEAASNKDELLTGTSGFFTYRSYKIKKIIAVMWSSSPLFRNVWNVKMYDADTAPDTELMYLDLYVNSFPGDGDPYTKDLSAGLQCSGSMSSGRDAELTIHVRF